MSVLIKRIYEQPSSDDGFRVLVDRMWPRGVSKEHADLDLWLKDIAPSAELRKWWNHNPETADEFSKRYRAELDGNPAVDTLRRLIAEHPVVTLLYGAKDPKLNQALVLQEYLLSKDD